jgi:hypothetical protein
MTEQEKNQLNGRIADALFGWDKRDSGKWADPTGDEYDLAPNYTDNSGLVVSIEYKLRARGFSLSFVWPLGQACEYKLTKNGQDYIGVGGVKSLAICLATQAVLDAGVLLKADV